MVVGDERFIYYIRDNVYGFAKIISHNSTERLIESPLWKFRTSLQEAKDCLNEIFATCAVVVAYDPVKISSPIKRNPHTRFIRRIFLFFVKKKKIEIVALNRNRWINALHDVHNCAIEYTYVREQSEAEKTKKKIE